MKLAPDLLTLQECESLLRVAGRGLTAKRNRGIIVTCWRAGLRISEALALRVQDVDWDTGRLTVMSGKGAKPRHSALGELGLSVVKEWKAIRDTLRLPRSAPLFCTLDGKPLNPAYVRQMLPRLGKRAGLDKRVHAHGLRHRFAVDLHDEGFRLADIQALLGHSSAQVTSVYLARLGADEANERALARS